MWFLFIIFGFLSQPWTELRGYKQVQYIDISGLSPSYNYIRGWLISKTNPSEPLTSSQLITNHGGQFYFLPRKKKGRLKEHQRLICLLTLIDWAELPLEVFTFISQVFVPLQFIRSNVRQIR